ncbi:MAG: DUF4089 domain-containing protein [Cyanobacteria bacterium J06648_16]
MSDSAQLPDPEQFPPHDAASSEAYVVPALQLLSLTVPAEQLDGVVKSFEQVKAIAQPVLDFTLPDALEAAPRFEP